MKSSYELAMERCGGGEDKPLSDEQKEKIKNSAEFRLIEDKYFELLREYDEFSYWKRENFGIGIDSKQNFDDNYESNWYYYYK